MEQMTLLMKFNTLLKHSRFEHSSLVFDTHMRICPRIADLNYETTNFCAFKALICHHPTNRHSKFQEREWESAVQLLTS